MTDLKCALWQAAQEVVDDAAIDACDVEWLVSCTNGPPEAPDDVRALLARLDYADHVNELYRANWGDRPMSRKRRRLLGRLLDAPAPEALVAARDDAAWADYLASFAPAADSEPVGLRERLGRYKWATRVAAGLLSFGTFAGGGYALAAIWTTVDLDTLTIKGASGWSKGTQPAGFNPSAHSGTGQTKYSYVDIKQGGFDTGWSVRIVGSKDATDAASKALYGDWDCNFHLYSGGGNIKGGPVDCNDAGGLAMPAEWVTAIDARDSTLVVEHTTALDSKLSADDVDYRPTLEVDDGTDPKWGN